jgi:uncharacterized protein (DUF58 family)
MSAADYLREGEAAARRFALSVPRSGPVNRAGAALGARAGSSLEFRDYRGYEPGDDLRHIDWNAFARSDQLNVKLYREEVSPHLDLLIDGSRSMALVDTVKARAVLALAGFFSAAAANAGFSHTGWLLAEDAQLLGDRVRRPESWETIRFDYRESPVTALGRVAARWRPRGVRVLISDLLWEADPGQIARQLADRAASAVVIQVLAATDVDPPEGGFLRLQDSETDSIREIRVDAGVVLRYRESLTRLQGHWHNSTRAVGTVFVTLVAEELLKDWKMDGLVAAGVLQVG